MIQNEELSTLIKTLIESHKTFESILPDLLITFGRELNSDWVAYWKIDTKEENFQLEKVWTNPLLNLTALRFESRSYNTHYGLSMVTFSWKTRKPIYSEDISKDMTLPRSMKAFSAGLNTGICFPIFDNHRTYGVIEALMKHSNAPTVNFLETIESIGFEIGKIFARAL